jgi:hypothetical protein
MTIQEYLGRDWEMLIGRDHGPMTFRLICQPLVAVILAIRAGLRDARAGRSPCFFWSVFTKASRDSALLQEAWRDVGKVFIVAVVLDVSYELIVYRWVYPVQSLIVATVLAIIPYALIRGPITSARRALPARAKKPPVLG